MIKLNSNKNEFKEYQKLDASGKKKECVIL
jgi:hypothetical protein